MIYELSYEDFNKVKRIFQNEQYHPVINGVINGMNRGRIFVNNIENPTAVLVWAINEMFYLAGDSQDIIFQHSLEKYIIDIIIPAAIQLGEDYFNLELYPHNEWAPVLPSIFKKTNLQQGERVPFTFHKDQFHKLSLRKTAPSGYSLRKIDLSVIQKDLSNIIKNEILKFWDSLQSFLDNGIGYCVLNNNEVIGTCISVFVSENEYEIGINTYQTEHRGKGLATLMAASFIQDCIAIGGNPHWTTESFRRDSIAIAEKLGFEKLEHYPVYFFPF
ncbi:GNAT family N-acetyltransferase [Bacillus sp. FJAT-49736]|uniref:GNAT family N-acetyltransferase n=1 Tax=Bacillus sp. FJAT-49736 TaxID=2833582 RepID=UPI001BCA5DBB|nr:GNAT family N-acetyltransferase [Bacillus sp. FJAT-49736]MBS4175009.1 GNAT family N-acetyltransferase [Bacillus sp. FJAT-49736]